MIVLRHIMIPGERVHVECEHDLTLEDIEQLVTTPPLPRCDDKDLQYKFYWGERLDNSRSLIADNWGIRTALVLDYDGSMVDKEVKFDDFYSKYNGKFQFYMHSSWNHIIKGVDKYRVIIPVEEPYWMSKPLENVLLRIFEGCDDSTFGNRGFYIPVQRPNYRYAISRGKILNMHCFDELVKNEIALEHEKQRLHAIKRAEMIKKYGDTVGSDEHKANWLRVVKEKLDQTSWNVDGSGRYSKLVNTIVSMQKHDTLYFDEFEIEEFLDEYISHLDSKNQRSLRKMIEKG
jgi:hypothetical protein